MGLSWSHILIVLVLFVLLFGRGKISELMGDVAQGIKAFKKGMSEDETAKTDTPPADPKTIDSKTSFKKGMSDDEEASAAGTKVIEHDGAKPAAKSASRAKAPRKQKTG